MATGFNSWRNDAEQLGLEYHNMLYGIYRGFCSDNKDPEHRGRIKLKVPQFYGEVEYDYWADSFGMFAGKGGGFVARPDKDDAVWIMFENGDVRFPVWCHGWFGEQEMPEIGNDENNKFFQTYGNRRWELNDKDKLARFYDREENQVLLNNKGTSLISDKIFLGSKDTADEKAALGDTLKAKLESLIDKIVSICDANVLLTVPTPVGISGTPINAAAFTAAKTALNGLKGELGEILSNKVKLDK